MIPYQTKRVVSATISGWVKKYCGYPVGVVTVLVKAHSTRAASIFVANTIGLSGDEILQSGFWSNKSTWQIFSKKDIIPRSAKNFHVSTNNILNNDTWQITLKKGGIEDWNLGSSDSERGSKNLILDRKLLNSAKIVILWIKSKEDPDLPALLPILAIPRQCVYIFS